MADENMSLEEQRNEMIFTAKLRDEAQERRRKLSGKTPMNILLSSINNSNYSQYIDDFDNSNSGSATLLSFVEQILQMRCMLGQNYNSMISAKDISNNNLKLRPNATKFYDKNNNVYYDLSEIEDSNSKLRLEYSKLCDSSTKDILTSGFKKDDKDAGISSEQIQSICDDLAFATGVKLVMNTDGLNTFLPLKGKSLKHSQEMLLKGGKFNSKCGNLYVDTKGLKPIDVLSKYIETCAEFSVNLNFKDLTKNLYTDRDFMSLIPDEKNEILDDLHDSLFDVRIRAQLEGICADLIASEMTKSLPLLTAQERFTLSQAYLLKAAQKINGLGDKANDNTIMKVVAQTVTDSVSKYNRNYGLTASDIMKINQSFNFKNDERAPNYYTSIFGGFEMPYAGPMEYTLTENPVVQKTNENQNEIVM